MIEQAEFRTDGAHPLRATPRRLMWSGREGFGRWLEAFLENWIDTPLDPVFHTCGEDMLASNVTMRATASSTGAQVEMPMCQVIQFSDNLPVEWRNFAWDTARMRDVAP